MSFAYARHLTATSIKSCSYAILCCKYAIILLIMSVCKSCFVLIRKLSFMHILATHHQQDYIFFAIFAWANKFQKEIDFCYWIVIEFAVSRINCQSCLLVYLSLSRIKGGSIYCYTIQVSENILLGIMAMKWTKDFYLD